MQSVSFWTVTIFLSIFIGVVLHAETEDEDVQRLRHSRSSSSSRVKRLIGGSDIMDGQWPWLINLRAHIPSSTWWIFATSYVDIYCGGTIVDKQWILTAAHCLTVPNAPSGISTASNWYIKAGTVDSHSGTKSFWDLSTTDQQSMSFWTVQGSKLFVHPDYSASNDWANDAALIKLSTALPLKPATPYIDKVALPTSVRDYWPPPGINCYMQGWGCTSLGGPVTEFAQGAMLPIISNTNCTYYGVSSVGRNRVCAGYRIKDTGICKGDSGGPLVCMNKDAWTIAGIASFTSANEPGDYPGVFTKVSKYTNWITNTIANN